MRRAIVLGFVALVIFAAGCGGSGSKPDGGGLDASAGSSGTGGTGTGGTGGSTGPHTVTLSSADALAFAAGQDGDGAWRALTAAGSPQSYTLDVTGIRYGLAYGCASAAGDSVAITIVQATVAETTRVTVACGALPADALVNVTGTVTGLTGTQSAQIDLGSRVAMATVAMPSYTALFPMGARDLFARRITTAPTFDRMIRRNAVSVASGATINVDFANDGFAPESHTVTFSGASASETTNVLVIFRNTIGGSPFGIGSFTSGNYLALPAAQLRAGDYHSVVAGASEGVVARRVRRLYTAAMSFTAVLPPLPPVPHIETAVVSPYVRPVTSVPAGFDVDRYDVTYTQSETAPARTRSWSVQMTRGWIGSGAANHTIPDLSSITGFQTWWGLVAAPGAIIQWQQFANWSDAGVADLLRADQTVAELDGREYRGTQRTGQIAF